MKALSDIRNWIILVLVAFMVITGIVIGKSVKKYLVEIEVLKYDKIKLETQISIRDSKINSLQGRVDYQESRIDSCMAVFSQKDKIIAAQEKKLSEALSQINGITADSSYQFLQRIAYNYPGALKFLFNALQIKGIHSDWLRARSAEKEIPELKSMIANCSYQFSQRDTLAKNLQRIVILQKASLDDCKQINKDNDKIIYDQDRTIKKERNRKNFWRIVSFTEPGIAVVLLLLTM